MRSVSVTRATKYVLRDRARIRFCVEDDSCGGCITVRSSPENFRFMVLARRFDRFIIPAGPSDIRQLEALTDISITTVAALKRAAQRSFEQNLAQGMRAIKIALAYYRELKFEETSENDAEVDFEKLMKGPTENRGFRGAFVAVPAPGGSHVPPCHPAGRIP